MKSAETCTLGRLLGQYDGTSNSHIWKKGLQRGSSVGASGAQHLSTTRKKGVPTNGMRTCVAAGVATLGGRRTDIDVLLTLADKKWASRQKKMPCVSTRLLRNYMPRVGATQFDVGTRIHCTILFF